MKYCLQCFKLKDLAQDLDQIGLGETSIRGNWWW